MTLPASRNTTYVAGVSEVKSADLNDLQDEIIDAYGRCGGEREIWIDASGFQRSSAATSAVFEVSGTYISRWRFVDADTMASPVHGLRQGERIKAFKVRGSSSGGGTFNAKLWRRTSTSNPTQIGSTLTHANTTTDQSHTLASPETVDAGDQFIAQVECVDSTVDSTFYGFCIVVERMPV